MDSWMAKCSIWNGNHAAQSFLSHLKWKNRSFFSLSVRQKNTDLYDPHFIYYCHTQDTIELDQALDRLMHYWNDCDISSVGSDFLPPHLPQFLGPKSEISLGIMLMLWQKVNLLYYWYFLKGLWALYINRWYINRWSVATHLHSINM